MKNNSKLYWNNISKRICAQHTCAIIIIILTVIASNSIYLFVTHQDPVIQRSGLASNVSGRLRGQNTIDPNDGFTSQALGVAAARQVTQGSVPLWNHNEGIGTPLAGEMQSAALFPFTIVQLLPNGSLIFHMLLEATAGIGMYLLLRQLKLRFRVALIGGILFALNGTFAWLTNAAFNPIAFLPFLLWGVERVRANKSTSATLPIIAISLALSLYAGFPETAFLDMLLVGAWTLVRMRGLDKHEALRYVGVITTGLVIGLLLASPILVAFLDYLPNAYTGGHSGQFAYAAIGGQSLAMLFLPYIYGSIDSFNAYNDSLGGFWGNVGGYITAGTLVLALVGVMYKKIPRGLRVLLVVWVVVATARIIGVPGITQLIGHIPGIDLIALYRYINPSLEAAAIILASFGLQMLLEKSVSKKQAYTVGALGLMIIVALLCVATPMVRSLHGAPHHKLWALSCGLIALGLLLLTYLAARYRSHVMTAILACLIVVEAMAAFLIPQLSAPSKGYVIDTAAVTFLQDNIGYGRFYTLGPIAPNYGSYFDIASINNNDLPIPASWADYITSHLDQNTNPTLFIGSFMSNKEGVTPQQALFQNLSNYADIGVKYIVTNKAQISAEVAKKYQLEQVYDDKMIVIYQMPYTKAYVTVSNGCTIVMKSRDDMTTSCSEPAKLTRLELYFPGWSATVNGKTVRIDKDKIYQSIALPKGTATIRFSYTPRGITIAVVLFWLGIVGLLWPVVDKIVKKWYKLTKNKQKTHHSQKTKGQAKS